MPDVLVRNVPQHTLEALKRRAAQHRRSLQQELHILIEAATTPSPERTPAQVARTIKERLARTGRTFSDSTPLVREDRER